MRITLNIGLAREGQPDLGVGDVLKAVLDHGFIVRKYAGHTSDTEKTLVVEATALQGACRPRIYRLWKHSPKTASRSCTCFGGTAH